jgi:hypothetical protein
MPAPCPTPPARRRLGWPGPALVLLLGADIALAWMVLQGAYVFLGMVWHAMALEVLPPGSFASHGRQFRVIRLLQGGAWIATVAVGIVWLSRAARRTGEPAGARRGGPGAGIVGTRRPGRWVAWCLGSLAAAGLGEALAAGLAGSAGTPLDLSGAMQVLIVAQLLEIAAAVLGIVVVRRMGQETTPSRPPGGG